MISKDILYNLKKDYSNLKIAQWFLDPLNKNGPDFQKNKKRILDKSDVIDSNFLTTSPDALSFLSKKKLNYFIPNPSDQSMETLDNFKKDCSNDVFFALSHGVHRGQLKSRSTDDREKFIKSLINKCKNIRFDIFGMDNIQPIWADQYFKNISNSKMGLNLSRGTPIKYYSSDRITQIIGNGLVTLIDEKTCYGDFFDDTEMVFYKNITDLSEKIEKISEDEKLRKTIGQKGKTKYMKYFNSTLVADFIINKTYEINGTKNIYGINHKMISIVIPTYNNLDYLKLCLKSLKKNSSFKHEIIIHINDGSDGTLDFVKANNYKHTSSDDNIGLCSSINKAAKLVSNQYILYSHDDMYFCPNWDKVLLDEVKSLNHDDFYLSGTMIEPNSGHIVCDFGIDLDTFKEDELLSKYKNINFYDHQGTHFAPHLVSKKMWDKVGGFSEEFNPGIGSDPDFNMKLWKEGVRIFKGSK